MGGEGVWQRSGADPLMSMAWLWPCKWAPVAFLLTIVSVAGLLVLYVPAHALAQEPLRGVALVIGQSEYSHLPKLSNPGNDAKRVDDCPTSAPIGQNA